MLGLGRLVAQVWRGEVASLHQDTYKRGTDHATVRGANLANFFCSRACGMFNSLSEEVCLRAGNPYPGAF